MLGSKIETLLAVAEYQNFTKAAASLSLTTSASWRKNLALPCLYVEKVV